MGEWSGDGLARRLDDLRTRIAAAAGVSGRAAESVTLVAAAKSRSAEELSQVVAAGVTHLGHNYVQEAATTKPDVLGPAVWHLIGHLQTNKAGKALQLFDRLDTIDSIALAQALSRRLAVSATVLPVLIEVNIAGESAKSGVTPDQAEELLTGLQQTPGLQCLGLMAMPPPGLPDCGRRHFAEVRELASRLRATTGCALPVLSMGMSDDFEAAIAEGATEVRLGTALFGPRRAPRAVGPA